MPQHLQKRPSFLMVTDTAMVRKGGRVYAFGPVVRELEVFQNLFDKLEWIGFDRPDLQNDPVMMPVPDAVQCLLLQRSGGDGLIKKLGVLAHIPVMLWHILGSVMRHEVIHTRGPSTPAFLAALLSTFFRNKIWWHKYAGNWGQVNIPFFYGLQRSWLSFASWSKVTINGRWLNQPSHCLSFANPCLDGSERNIGKATIKVKEYGGPLHLCFVGRLESAKGIDLLMDALAALPAKSRIACLHLVGDGPLRAYCEMKASALPFEVKLYGFQSRHAVGHIMEACHLLILPSKAEGFPKVIAEGANYGCVPVVSDISGIAQYVHHGITGFLLSPERLRQGALDEDLQVILSSPDLKSIAEAAYQMAEDFTFERYGQRIREEILRLPA